MSSHCDIINLPIEILDLVYKYIPGVRDKLNLAKSHCVLKKAFAFHAGIIFKEIEIGDLPIEYLSDILSLCGSSVTSIRATNSRYTVVKLASKHCPNLEKLGFRVCRIFWYQIKSLLLTLQNLSHIEIWQDSENVSVVDILLQMPKLKHLKLSGFTNHDFERVGELANLTKLTIINQGPGPFDIFKYRTPLKNIVSLELDNAVFRMPKDLSDEQLLPKIELLKVDYGIFLTPLPYLPTLKYFTIGEIDFRNSLSHVFGKSVFNYGKTLEYLNFCTHICSGYLFKDYEIGIITKLKALKKLEFQVKSDDCLHDLCQLENLEELSLGYSEITNRGPIILIKGCTKLRQLDISQCYQLQSDMIEEIVAALQCLRPRSDKPFLLRVSVIFAHVDKSKLGGVLDIEYVPPHILI